jgi:predicted tellurium resistance membrane protein TerC
MADNQRERRATLIREHPLIVMLVLYSVCFLGCSMAIDSVAHWMGATYATALTRYLLPLAIAQPTWIGVLRWSCGAFSGHK